MLKTKLWATGFILLALAGATMSLRFTSTAQKQDGESSATDPILGEIASYRQWERVNKRPLVVTVTVAKIDPRLLDIST